MSKPLVIVESPAKARTIGKFLGGGYTVRASMGHVRDLPRSGLSVDPENDFAADWEPIKDRAKVVGELRKLVARADTVYLATDPDREGEAIAWHLVELLLGEDGTKARTNSGVAVHRVHFHEITKAAIAEAFEQPGRVNEALVDAYRARRILDRLVGYQLSELLWRKLTRGLSAGRVQSVAVKLVVDRELEIRAFVPREYWKIGAVFGEGEQAFTAEFKRLDGKAHEPADRAAAEAVLRRLLADGERLPAGEDEGRLPAVRGGPFTLSSLKQQPRKVSAKPPFKTSTLQQAAAGRYGFTAKRTMRIAQQLYEGVEVPGEGAVGLITYMRTDSFNLAGAAIDAARGIIESQYGREFLPDKPNFYRSGKSAQEAHEAIRPTEPRFTPEKLRRALTDEQWKLYDLIWRRFISCQMTPAEYLVTTLEIERGGATFTASGRVTTHPGFTRVYGTDKDEEQGLPELQEGQSLQALSIDATRHFTPPPRRYSEASLVRALEEHGIGRPSTYASILSTIVDRKYVDHGEEAEQEALRAQLQGEAAARASAQALADEEGEATDEAEAPAADGEEYGGGPRARRKSAFHATRLGEVVTRLLEPQFADIVNTGFTAKFETDLDRIAEGEVSWLSVVKEFHGRFASDLEAAREGMAHYREHPLVATDITCGNVDKDTGAVCGAPMVVLFNRGGAYLGCSRYPDCSYNLPLSGVRAAAAELSEHTCRARNDKGELCGRPMEKKVNRWGRPFLACTGFKTKDCKGAVSVSVKGEPLWPVETEVPCPNCGRMLSVKRSRRGKFLACPGYPKCRGTLNPPKCTHESRTGKTCDAAMTEPGGPGLMRCPEHPDVLLPPPAPRERAGKVADGAGEPGAEGAPAKGKAKTKAGAAKKTARKAPARKAAARRKASPAPDSDEA